MPEYIAQGGKKEALQMVEGADTMLDIISMGADNVTISMSTGFFEGADRLELVEICDPGIGGGYYMLPSFEDRPVSQRMWLCGVTNFVFGYLPEEIFIRRLR
ncbi:MAG: hypothetical protein JST39_21085 [Bacteroidetes bacterium]|nr:hypothetical protein [Bacteroidota bacterium]